MIAEAFLIGCVAGSCTEQLRARRRAHKTRPAVAVVSSEETGRTRFFSDSAAPTAARAGAVNVEDVIVHAAPCSVAMLPEELEFPIIRGWDEAAILACIADIEAL